MTKLQVWQGCFIGKLVSLFCLIEEIIIVVDKEHRIPCLELKRKTIDFTLLKL